jgi:serine/threonine protein kinase KIN1/2
MAAAAGYPTSLATNHLEIVTEAGAITPSHGGMVQGHEFDLPISQKIPDTEQAQTPVRDPPQLATNGAHATPPIALPAPPGQGVSPRRTTSVNKPRPVSMPPQPSVPPANDRDRQHGEDGARRGGKTESVSGTRRTSNRVLGDYTLSKTLGAGSMGKVKLAHHNITGEKVRDLCP